MLKLKLQSFSHSLEKTLMLGKTACRRWRGRQGTREDRMVGWNHRRGGRVWVSSGRWWGQGSLACCTPWGRKELDTTEWLNNNNHLTWGWWKRVGEGSYLPPDCLTSAASQEIPDWLVKGYIPGRGWNCMARY